MEEVVEVTKDQDNISDKQFGEEGGENVADEEEGISGGGVGHGSVFARLVQRATRFKLEVFVRKRLPVLLNTCPVFSALLSV